MLIDYRFVTGGLPDLPACMYQYLVGCNGTFVRAKRPGLSAIVPAGDQGLRGLGIVTPTVKLHVPPVPEDLVAGMLARARQVSPREILFYLLPPADGHNWRLATPAQKISRGAVSPLDPFNEWGQATLIEVHSHHNMRAFFSGTDNQDESSGFRLYGVLGEINTFPVLRLRVGIYGHFWPVPASMVFDMPLGLQDAFRQDQMEDNNVLRYDFADA